MIEQTEHTAWAHGGYKYINTHLTQAFPIQVISFEKPQWTAAGDELQNTSTQVHASEEKD